MAYYSTHQRIVDEKNKRIAELEKIICPNGHDFQPVKNQIPTKEISFAGGDKEEAIVYYHRCVRCNKQKIITTKEEIVN